MTAQTPPYLHDLWLWLHEKGAALIDIEKLQGHMNLKGLRRVVEKL